MKKGFLKEKAAILSIIIAILITAMLNFIDIIPADRAATYLFGAIAGLAIEEFLSLWDNDKNIDKLLTSLEAFQKDTADKLEQHRDALAAKIEYPATSKKVTRKEHYTLLTAAALKSKKEIWIMTIDRELNRRAVKTIVEREIYYDTIYDIIHKRRDVVVRRIYGIPTDTDERKDKIKWILSDIDRAKGCPNYHVSVFDWRKFKEIPTPLSLQIIDDSFVGMVNLHDGLLGVVGGGEDICITDINVVQHLKLYYESVWEACDKIKIGDDLRTDSLV